MEDVGKQLLSQNAPPPPPSHLLCHHPYHLPSPGCPRSSVEEVGAGAAAVRRAAGRLGCRPDAPGARASPGHPSPQSSSGFATYASGFCRVEGQRRGTKEEQLHHIPANSDGLSVTDHVYHPNPGRPGFTPLNKPRMTSVQ